jgi:poly(3-hydroxybutyrate) depolymerase
MHYLKSGLAVAALAGLASAAKPSSGCGKEPALEAGNHTATINEKERWYLVRHPKDYNATQPYRLVLTLHAAGGNASMVTAGVGGYLPWYGLPDHEPNAIYISPNGLDRGWANRGGEDVSFVKEMVRQAKAGLCVDENLLFSVGFSYGAAMSYAIACSLADQFRAVAAQSGGAMSGCDGGDKPIAFYGQHGVDGDLNIGNARAIRDKFVKLNGCTPMESRSPEVGSGKHTKMVYDGCTEGHPVTWIEYDGGHTPQPRDAGANKTFAADEVWEFFSKFK